MTDNTTPAYSTSTHGAPRGRWPNRPSRRTPKARPEPLTPEQEARIAALGPHLSRWVTAEEAHLAPARVRRPHSSREWPKLDLQTRLVHVEEVAERERRPRRPASTMDSALRKRLNRLPKAFSACAMGDKARTAPLSLITPYSEREWSALSLAERIGHLEARLAEDAAARASEPSPAPPAPVPAPVTTPERPREAPAPRMPAPAPLASPQPAAGRPVRRVARLPLSRCVTCGDFLENVTDGQTYHDAPGCIPVAEKRRSRREREARRARVESTEPLYPLQ